MYIYFITYYFLEDGNMPLMRKTMFSSNNKILINPRQLVKAYSIKNGDVQKFIPLNEEIRIRKFMISDSLKDNK